MLHLSLPSRPQQWFILIFIVCWCVPFSPRTPTPVRADEAYPPVDALVARVRGPGVVTFTGQQLRDAGWTSGAINPALVQVWRRGKEVPIAISGSADGRLDAGDTLRFLADDGTRWSADATYWFIRGTMPGQRTTLPDAPGQPLFWERDLVYASLAQAERSDRWFAGELRDGGSPISITLTLPAALPAHTPITLGVTALPRQAHQLRVRVFNQAYSIPPWTTTTVTAGRPTTVSFSLPRPLPAGNVTLAVSLSDATPDSVYLDTLTIPSLVVPLPMLTPTLSAASQVDLSITDAAHLVIAPTAFHAALTPLVASRNRHDLPTRLIALEAIEQQYGWGERDPDAIRAFLRDVHARAPIQSVLLVGDGSVQLRHRAVEQDGLILPPFLLDTDALVGEIPCDTCYARLSHDVRNDRLPAFAVGRFPVRSVADVDLLVQKTITAIEAPPSGVWRTQALFLSDNDVAGDGSPDAAGPFAPLAATIQGTLAPTMTLARFVYEPAARVGGYVTSASVRRPFFAAFDAGAALVTYVGHASPWQWAAVEANDAPPYLVSTYDSDRQNGSRLPILLSLTCLSGQWTNMVEPTIDERLLLAPNGGTIASLSPAGSSVNTGHPIIAEAAMSSLIAGASLGDSHMAVLAALADEGRYPELLYSYNLLGDPVVTLPRSDHRLLLPMVRRP
jgi:hypothetical protein